MDVDNVKIEKENAIARYYRFRKIVKLLKMVEVIVALALLSWSSTRLPAALKISGDYLIRLSVYLFNPHVVFLIGNAIVIALFVLSRKNEVGNISGKDNICDEHLRNSEAPKRVSSASDGESSPPSAVAVAVAEERIGDDEEVKQMVVSENIVSKLQCDAVAKAIEQATKRIQRFKRTQSEKLKREIAVNSNRKLRRSVTETRQLMISSGERRSITPIDKVDSLSSEEFRLTIDAYIEKQKVSFGTENWRTKTVN